MRPQHLYLAEVEWVDSAGNGDWHEPAVAEGHLDEMACSAVGHVLVDDERGLVLALGLGDMGSVLSSMSIPRVAITAVHRLERSEGADTPPVEVSHLEDWKVT